jgi:hypothetical protein
VGETRCQDGRDREAVEDEFGAAVEGAQCIRSPESSARRSISPAARRLGTQHASAADGSSSTAITG